jgi:hypothetical protein
MLNDSVNIEKHTKTYLLKTCVIKENAKLRKIKKQASTSTDLTPTAITYNYDQANEYFQKNITGNSSGYACDICDRLWYINDLKK